MLDNEELLEKIIDLKEESGMSYDEISIKSKVPLTSIKRYFNGETKSPGFLPLCSIIQCLGGSVDEIIGIAPHSHKPVNDDFVQHLKSDLRYERKQKIIWSWLFVAIVCIIVGMLIFDLLNPEFGYIRYMNQLGYNFTPTSVSVLRSILT